MDSKENINDWWINLGEWWKTTFKQYIFHIYRNEAEEKSNDLTMSEIEKIFELETINLWGEVDSLEPLRRLSKLKKFVCTGDDMEISNLEPVKNLEFLETVNIVGTKISDLSPLENSNNLKELFCFRTKVTSIRPIMNLKKMELLWIGRQAPINEIMEFQQLHPNCRINPKSDY